MKKKVFMLIMLLLLGVGFAAVSTMLYLNGNVNIGTNDDDFDVIFTRAVLDGTNISSTAIKESGKKITFETNDLITVGDISRLDFDVTNSSEMYDAEVSIECTAAGDKSSYYEITKEVASPILGKTTEPGHVQVKLLKASVDDFSETFTCTLKATAIERTSRAEDSKIYYAYGEPTTSSTHDYTTLTYPIGPNAGQQAKVFAKLEGSQKSVCIVRKGKLECFKNNNQSEEKIHAQEVFNDVTCTSDDHYVYCNASDFNCNVGFDGYVYCYDYAADIYCSVHSDGGVYCSE